nr:hypothetical protein [uncultured bacterium]
MPTISQADRMHTVLNIRVPHHFGEASSPASCTPKL